MTELWFYSGRVGNCMFMYAFTRLVGELLGTKISLPKGTEITEFPVIAEDAKDVEHHEEKYVLGDDSALENARTIKDENDNMAWFLDPAFKGEPVHSFSDIVTIKKIMDTPEVYKKWLVLLGNFEVGENYYNYRNRLRAWFRFPEIDLSKFEFFKLSPDLGKGNWFERAEFVGVHEDDLVISLRLEDYTNLNNLDRLLAYDYFKIILESRNFNKVYIITNPGSIGHNEQYKFLKEFFPYDPIFVRIYDKPIMSMAFGAQFNNIAISQSTYSWWLGFLSHAKTVYYPIPKTGPFALNDPKFPASDLRVPCSEFVYVDYAEGKILPADQYTKIDYANSSWKN